MYLRDKVAAAIHNAWCATPHTEATEAQRRDALKEADAALATMLAEPTIRAEDWENACHEIIWKADPTLHDRIEEQARRERDERVASRALATAT